MGPNPQWETQTQTQTEPVMGPNPQWDRQDYIPITEGPSHGGNRRNQDQ